MKLRLLTLMSALLLMSSMAFAEKVMVDLDKSHLKWTGTKVTGKHFGKVPLKSAHVEMKDKKIIGGEFVADLANFTVEDLEGDWAKKFITHMKSEDFFEVKKFPTATLKIKSVNNGKAKADLTIKGKTHPVKFDIKSKDGAYTGTLKFDRTKFDMVYGSKNFFKNLGDKAINNEVVVEYKFVTKK